MGQLRSLALGNFRSYERLQLQLNEGVNLFLGANGQGKTNILEGIHYLSLLRSFRTTQLKTMIRWGESDFMIRGEVMNDGRSTTVALQQGQKRRLLLNRKPVSLASDFIGHLFCVTFVPEDMQLVKGRAGDRRRYLDILASQLEPRYLLALQEYQVALKSRNSLLRHRDAPTRQIRAYDTVLARRAAVILSARQAIIGELQGLLEQLGDVATRHGTQTLRYVSTLPPVEADESEDAATERYMQIYEEGLSKDLNRQQTLRGPHRDELKIALDDRLLGDFGSEGQCRLAVLALKMAAGELLLARKGSQTVIWLVDDVVGELDAQARSIFFACLRRAHQTFVVGTDDSLVAELEPAAIFDVRANTATPRS